MANENNNRLSSLGMFSPKNLDGNKISPAQVAEYCQEGANETAALKEPLGKVIAMRPSDSNMDALQRVNNVIAAFTQTATTLTNQAIEKQGETANEGVEATRTQRFGF